MDSTPSAHGVLMKSMGMWGSVKYSIHICSCNPNLRLPHNDPVCNVHNIVMNIYSFLLFLLSITWLSTCWSHDQYHLITLLLSLSFWCSTLSMPITFRSYLTIISDHISYRPMLLSFILSAQPLIYLIIFHLIFTASYLFDYLCTFYILSYCSIFRSLPIGHSTPLISWHRSSLSFLLNSKYFLHSYW